VHEIGGAQVRELMSARSPLALVMTPVEKIEHMQTTVMEEHHDIAHKSVVTPRPPILDASVPVAQDLDLAPGDVLSASAQSGHLRVGQRPLPEGQMIDLAMESAPQLALFRYSADQIRAVHAANRSMRPLLIDQNTIDEHFQTRPCETHDDIMPICGPDRFDRDPNAKDALVEIPGQAPFGPRLAPETGPPEEFQFLPLADAERFPETNLAAVDLRPV
jgi:hypothetical protein